MKCSKCNFETDSDQGFKAHMSKTHKGYSVDDLKRVGITPNRADIARALAGNTSPQDVTSNAPEKEPSVGQDQPQTRTRRSKAALDPEVEKAKEQIIRLRCQRIASLPYTLLANLLGEEAIKLKPEEELMLTESYVTLAKAYGWEGTSKLLLWGDVCICQATVIAAPERKDAILTKLNSWGQPVEVLEQTELKKETVQ